MCGIREAHCLPLRKVNFQIIYGGNAAGDAKAALKRKPEVRRTEHHAKRRSLHAGRAGVLAPGEAEVVTQPVALVKDDGVKGGAAVLQARRGEGWSASGALKRGASDTASSERLTTRTRSRIHA